MSKPFVMVNLDKPRKLRYTTNAMVMLEEVLGKPINVAMAEFSEGLFGFKDIRSILWAGLLSEDPNLTPEDVGNLLDEAENFTEVMNKIGEALKASFGDGNQKNVQKPKANGTGNKLSE